MTRLGGASGSESGCLGPWAPGVYPEIVLIPLIPVIYAASWLCLRPSSPGRGGKRRAAADVPKTMPVARGGLSALPLAGSVPRGHPWNPRASVCTSVPGPQKAVWRVGISINTLSSCALFTLVLCCPHPEASRGNTVRGPGPLPSVESGPGGLTSPSVSTGLVTPTLPAEQGRRLASGSYSCWSPRKPAVFCSSSSLLVSLSKLTQSLLEPPSFLEISDAKVRRF